MLGLICGIIIATCSVGYASGVIQTSLFPVEYWFNSQPKVLSDEYATLNYNGHAYVPVRFIVENMGGTVEYNPDYGMISIRQPLVVPYRNAAELGTFSIEGYITKVDNERILIVSPEPKTTGEKKEFYDAVWVSNVPKEVKVGQKVQVSFQGIVMTSYPGQAMSDKISFAPNEKPEHATLSEEQAIRQAIQNIDDPKPIAFVVKKAQYDEASDTWSIRYKDGFHPENGEHELVIADK